MLVWTHRIWSVVGFSFVLKGETWDQSVPVFGPCCWHFLSYLQVMPASPRSMATTANALGHRRCEALFYHHWSTTSANSFMGVKSGYWWLPVSWDSRTRPNGHHSLIAHWGRISVIYSDMLTCWSDSASKQGCHVLGYDWLEAGILCRIHRQRWAQHGE